MHAEIDDLLAIKNGEESPMLAHVNECTECQSELIALSAVGAQLFAHYDSEPSDLAWSRIQRTLAADANADVIQIKPSNIQSISRAIYALAASIAFVGVVSVFMLSGNSQNQQTQLLQASVNQLMTNSRGLEQALQQVAQQNQALSVANQQAADKLYWRLTYVDQLIQGAQPQDSEQLKVLWRDRVDALNALNKLYFERDNTIFRSEI